MGIWQSYKSLSKRQRLLLGLIGIGIGLSGPTVLSWVIEGRNTKEQEKVGIHQENEKKN